MTTSTTPTIDQLNRNTAGRNWLLLLRVLNTSDLAFSYQLLEPSTLKDIAGQAKAILDIEQGWDGLDLSQEEITEYRKLCADIVE